MKKLTFFICLMLFANAIFAQKLFTPGKTNFEPVYLRCDNAADLQKINTQITSLQNEIKKRLSQAKPIDISQYEKIQSKATPLGRDIPDQIVQKEPAAANPAPLVKKVETLTISPSGNVELDATGSKTFSVTANVSTAISYYVWYIAFQDFNGTFTNTHCIAITDVNAITFKINNTVYPSTVNTQNKQASFIVRCLLIDKKASALKTIGPDKPDPIVIGPFVPPTPYIHHLVLNKSSFKGGANGDDPTLTVYLTAPAPAGGQIVYLKTNCQDRPGCIAHVFTTGSAFSIPAGQTSGSISGFLGTEKVMLTRTFNIVAIVNKRDAFIEVTLTRK